MEPDFLFVYGKLREIYVNPEILNEDLIISREAKIEGLLYFYKNSAVMIDSKGTYVKGNLITSSNMKILLRHTDAFLEFNENDYINSKYVRVIKTAKFDNSDELIKVWCYVFSSIKKYELDENGKLIENGDWIKYKKEIEKLKENKKGNNLCLKTAL